MKKMFITIMICLSLFGVISMNTASATQSPCSKTIVNNYYNNPNFGNTGMLETAVNCSCDKIKDKGVKSNCNKMKSELASGSQYSDSMVRNQIGAEYRVTKIGNIDAKYVYGMKNLWHIVKAVLNVFIGVLLFILGFGFVYNITSLGMHSSNPQMRQMCIQKLGDVFATALFVGLIPLVFQFITSLITAIN